tara:strand:+ start:4651 stop:5775 length:1125 start_codon:yes stop_codon:yes gene_type:complete
MSFCECHDDYVNSGTFDIANARVYTAFQVFHEGGKQPMPGQDSATPIMDRFLAFYADGQASGAYPAIGANVVTLPADPPEEGICSNYDEDANGNLSLSDARIYTAFQVFHEGGRQPMPGQSSSTSIMDRFLAFYADGQASGAYPAIGADVKHLPILSTDTEVITSTGIVPKCVEVEDKLWVAFTGNDHYTEWYEMETNEDEDFTKFLISAEAHPNVGTELQTWASDKTTNLQGILMTASPSKPSASTLTDDQQAKTFNSNLLKFNCDGTYNADHGVNTNQVNLRVKAFNNQNVSSIKKYGSEGSTHGYLASGKPWEGANMVYRTTTFSSIVRDDSGKNSIDIEYMYFIKQTDEAAKIKFSDATPSNSTCDLFAE